MINVRLQVRRDTVANFVAVNPVLADGEVAYEWDAGQLKIGDGVKAYQQLGYVNDSRVMGIVGRSAYEEAVASGGFTGTVQEWLASLGAGAALQGAKGDKGDKGDTGAAGAQGIQGLKGDKGDKGDTGAAGANGLDGAQGLKGDKGDKGDTGAAGAQGIQGLKGDTGATGAAGAQGIQGLKGDTGATGAAGAQGIQGLKGDTGATGATGATGVAGANGAGLFRGTQVILPSLVVGTGATQPHNLGAGKYPDYVEVYVECMTANNGYAIGDRIRVTNSQNLTLMCNATDVWLWLNAQFTAMTRTGGTTFTLPVASWRLVAEPYVFV